MIIVRAFELVPRELKAQDRKAAMVEALWPGCLLYVHGVHECWTPAADSPLRPWGSLGFGTVHKEKSRACWLGLFRKKLRRDALAMKGANE